MSVINELLQRGKEERLYPAYNTTKEANWIGHILRRNCLLKHVIEEDIMGENTRKKAYASTG
jgi:hypothetical protein